jgi:AraC-like DNA-binding protein
MAFRFQTDDFQIEYTESEIHSSILWERHCHARYEMIAVLDGDITVMLEGQKHRLQKNQVIIIPPLFYHSITANEEGSYHRITALFGIDAIPEVLRNDLSRQGRDTTIPTAVIEKIRDVCQKEDVSFYAPLLQSLAVEIFYEALLSSSPLAESEEDDFLQKALQYIDKHLGEKILLDDLAKITRRSKSSFCHLFERKMKISPKQYILQKKLALASKLIQEGTPRTVAAMQIGYDNYSNFYRSYLRQYGITPTVYKKNH